MRPSTWFRPPILALLLGALTVTPIAFMHGEDDPRVPDQSVTLDGIKFNYIDWGGHGETLVLLAGFHLFGDCARNFDQFASRLGDGLHVLGFTRRGVYLSDKPVDGYDTATRVEDLRRFLDAQGIDRASFLGDGAAGDEMTLFAQKYPQRVNKLVYLSPLELSAKYPEVALKQANQPPWIKRLLLRVLDSPQAAKMHPELKPAAQDEAVMLAMCKAVYAFHGDYTAVQAPALGIFANPEKNNPVWKSNPPHNAKTEAASRWWEENVRPKERAAIEDFRRGMRQGQVVELDFAGDHLYEWSWMDVIPQVRHFLLDEPLPRPTKPAWSSGWFSSPPRQAPAATPVKPSD